MLEIEMTSDLSYQFHLDFLSKLVELPFDCIAQYAIVPYAFHDPSQFQQ
jgi:hypothetical protein